jgi:predicted nuclease of predicted toxin-antitoxin system
LKFFIDESLSPEIARRLNIRGIDAIHPRDVGRCGEPDHEVLRRSIEEDRVIVTENKRDFRALVRGTELHQGLILLPSAVNREGSWMSFNAILQHIDALPSPEDYMVNRVIEISADGTLMISVLPPLP